MTRHYPDLGSASDWLCPIGNLLQSIRSCIQIWVVTRHQYGISARVSQTSFPRESSRGITYFPLVNSRCHATIGNHTFSHDRCSKIPCYNKANYTSPLIDVSVKKDSSLVYVLKFFGKCWKFFVKCWLLFSGKHVLGICFCGFSAVIIRIIDLSVMWLCNVIIRMEKMQPQ